MTRAWSVCPLKSSTSPCRWVPVGSGGGGHLRGEVRLALLSSCPLSQLGGGVEGFCLFGEKMPSFPCPGSQQAPTTPSSSLTFVPWAQEEGDTCDRSLSRLPSLFGAVFGKLDECGLWRV